MRPWLALLATTAVLLGGTSAPAQAKDTTLLSKTDKRGDVSIYKGKKISKTKKKSIDIDRASIVRLSNGKYRYKVRIKKVYTSRKWDQMVFFDAVGGSPRTYASVGFKTRNSGGAYASNSATEDTCRLAVKRKGREFWVDVPARCAAYDGDAVKVTTATGHYQSDAPLYSRDTLSLGRFNAGTNRVFAVPAGSTYEAVCQFAAMDYDAGNGTFALRCSPYDWEGRDSGRYVDDYRYYKSPLAHAVTGTIADNRLTLDPQFGSTTIDQYQYVIRSGGYSRYFDDYRDFERVQSLIPKVLTSSPWGTISVYTDHDLYVDYYYRETR